MDRTGTPTCDHHYRALWLRLLLLAMMQHSIGDDDDYGFGDFSPQQRTLEQPDATTGATKYAVMLTIFCIGVIQFRGKF